MRTVGVEEELLLVDERSGDPLSVAGAVLRHAQRADEVDQDTSQDTSQETGQDTGQDTTAQDQPGGTIGGELQQQQVETDTRPHTDLAALEVEIRDWRRRADEAARSVGGSSARVAALGTSPLLVTPRTTPSERYLRMGERFGLTEAEQLTCGCHVHVGVESDDEGVAVLDRIRGWLPVLTALSANSPFWQGQDSGYASYRSQVWGRWPSAGPIAVLGTPAAYRRLVGSLLASGVLLDEQMVYFDARLSVAYPTVEIRVADVCQRAEDAVLVAGLSRALVETAARAWRAGEPAADVPEAMLRMASWQASRSGVDDVLVHPVDGRPHPAADVVHDLLAHLRPALADTGDLERVEAAADAVLARGPGARRQREVADRTGDLAAVVRDAIDVTTTATA